MTITITYDLKGAGTADRNAIRSIFEWYGWSKLGGSVFRYGGVRNGAVLDEDWLNVIVPALMHFRSYIVARGLELTVFTLDAVSVGVVNLRDDDHRPERYPQDALMLPLVRPEIAHLTESQIRGFVSAATQGTK